MRRLIISLILILVFATSSAFKPGWGLGINGDITVSKAVLGDKSWEIGTQWEFSNKVVGPVYMNSILSPNLHVGYTKNFHESYFALHLTELIGVDVWRGLGLLTGPDLRYMPDSDATWRFYWGFGLEKIFFTRYNVRLIYMQHLTKGHDTFKWLGGPAQPGMNHIRLSITYRF